MLKSLLPFLGNKKVHKRLDELFSWRMMGSFLVAKFTGDYAAIKMTDAFGDELGYLLGIFLSIFIVLYWEHLEHKADSAKEKAKETAEGAKDKVDEATDAVSESS